MIPFLDLLHMLGFNFAYCFFIVIQFINDSLEFSKLIITVTFLKLGIRAILCLADAYFVFAKITPSLVILNAMFIETIYNMLVKVYTNIRVHVIQLLKKYFVVIG